MDVGHILVDTIAVGIVCILDSNCRTLDRLSFTSNSGHRDNNIWSEPKIFYLVTWTRANICQTMGSMIDETYCWNEALEYFIHCAGAGMILDV